MKESAKKIAALCLAACLLFIAVPSAHAEEQAAATKNWEFNLVPMYIWFVDLNGTIPVDVAFSDIWDNLEAIFTVHFEGVHRKKWGFIVDVTYLDLSVDINRPILRKMDFVNVIAEFDGFYRFDMGYQALDLIAGVRYNKLEPEITTSGVGPIPPSLKTDEDWVDPLIGGRYIREISDKWHLILRADLGGFGVGSDFVWNVAGFLDYRPWKHVSLIGGYRALDTDYKNSGSTISRYDVRLAGPLAGINIFW
jgi:hypothetical protein